MPNVQMPNGVVVAFPDDMPREQISALIASKFPTEARNALSDSGKKPYQGVLEGSATTVGNIPALLAKTKAGIGQAAAESAHQLFDPTFDENIRTPPLEEIVKPGAPVAEMLTAPAARMTPSWNLGSVLPDDWRKAAAQVTAREALAQRLRGMKAAEEVKPLDMDPRTPGGYVAQTAGAVAEMAAPAALSLMVKNPGPLMVYFGARAGGEKYFEARQEGNTVSASQTGAALYAAAELGTEAIGGHIFVHGAGKTFLGTVLKNAATEGLTEGATEALQALVDAGVLHEDMTLDQALNRVKDATIVGAMAGGTISAVTHPLRGKADTSSPAPAVDPGSVSSTGSNGAPAAALPPPSPQLALPSPEAYAVPDAIRRQLNQNADAAVLDQTAVPDPTEEVDAIARIALKRTKQAETAALLQTARETIAPIGTFEAAELPDDVALQVGRHRATRGRAIDTPITVDDMVRAKVPQAKIDAVIALRKPVTAGRIVTPDEIRLVAKSKNIRLDSNFNELARRAVGSSKLEDMTPTQLSVLHDTVTALPEHEAPVTVPLAERPVFTDKQYADAVAAVRKQGRYTIQAVKDATGLKNDADARAVRDAMVRRGQLVQRGDKDFRLYDVLGEQEKATPAKLPEGAFREHVVRRMPIGAVTLQVNGKARGKFASEAAASEAVFRLREKEARERKPDSKPADVKIIPAGETGYGVIENRYDAQGNFLGQAVVESHRNEGPARDAADRLNNPREGAKPRPAEAAPEKLPGGRFILRENGQIVDQVFNTPTELREELRRRRAENQRLGLQPPALSVEAAPGVTEAPPVTPRPAPTNIPPGLAGRLAEVTDRLQAIAHTRGLPLLGTKVRLTPEVKLGGQTIEGVFTPSKNLIRLTTIHLKPDMSLDEVVDTLAAVMDHETIHALKEAGVLPTDSKAWKTLNTYAAKAIKPGTDTTYLEDAHANYDGRPGYETMEDIEEEAIAEVFRYWAADRRNVAGKPATALRQIVEWFRRLISGVPTSVLKDIESGAMVRAKFPPPGSTTRTAKNQQNLSQATTAMAAAQASGSVTGMQYVRRQYVRARDQSREDRFGHTGGKTVIGDVPSLAYQTGERDIDVGAQLADRVDNAGIGRKKRLRTYLPEPDAFLRKMAAAQEAGQHEPNREAVSRAYFTLNAELKAIVTALNLKVTSFAGPGEPYVSQAAMLADVARGQLKMRMSVDQFGTTPDNSDHPLYKQSGINTTDGKPLTYNDLLRVVVDVLGYGQTGLGYGPRDGYNAYHAVRPFFSDMALPALATETLVQHAWQHYGKHLRRPDGTLPDSDDIDYLPLDQRQYPAQKAFVLSLAELNADPGVQSFEEAANAEDLGEDVRYSVYEPDGDRYSIDSPAFKSWFGGSKVTDEFGLPKRVFHATAAVSFDEFDTKRSEMGTHFGTYRQAHAMAYELSKDKPRIFKTGIGTHMYPIYLSIKRPLRLRDESSFGNDYVAPQLAELGIIDGSYANLLKGYGYQNRLALQNAIKAAGYDGVVYLNRVEGVFDKSAVSAQSSEQFDRDVRELTDEAFKEKYPTAEDSWIIFEPTQAKSAIGNLGTYDPNNPDMRYSISSPQFDAYLQRAYVELTPKDLTSLPNIEHGLTGPIPVAVLAARDYAKAAGLPVRRQAEYVKVDVERARRIANAYAAMPHAPEDPAVKAAYQAMAEETIAQYKAVKATGLKIETILPGMDDPYPAGPRDVLRDIARGHIWYFPTEDGFGSNDAFDPSANPLLAPTDEVSDNGKPMVVNDLFRVVHDFFGHGIEGTGFGPRGEENAWQSHMRLFSERAVPAMTSETRGQNSWVNYGPYGERNRANPRETVYADQKTGVMPEWTWREGVVDDTPDDPNAPRQLRDVGAFTAAFDAARKARPEGGMVHRYADEDYAGMKLFLTPDNMAGFAIKDDGDIVSVFANPAGPRGRLPVLMQAAVAAGGRKLDAFDAGLPQMYAKQGFVETGRVPWDDLYAPEGWDYAKFGRPDVVFMSYAGPEATAEDSMKYSLGTGKLLTQVPGLKGALKYLTEPERERITARTAANFVSLFEKLPDAKEMAAVAFSGRAKRGWYNKSAEALVDIFGIEDAPRFAALLAALSPQNSVEANAINALNTWVEWDKVGRPTDRKKIMGILGRSVQGGKGLGSVLDAWKNNTLRALVAEDPQSIVLSGPKVNSFMLNLRKVTNEVTNDAWMANYANVNQELFRAARVAAPTSDPVGGQLGVKSAGYLAMSAVARKAATIASDMTGETWTPAEIQETVWSWAKTLYEKASSAASARDLLAAGKMSHAEIGATPDFATLFIGGVYRNILEKGGYANPVRAIESRGPAYDPSALAGEPVSPEGSGFAQGAFDTHLRRAARRLDARRAAVNANEQADIAAAYDAKFAQPEEPSPTMSEEDWAEMARFSVSSPQFEAALGDRLPGGRLYGNNAASPGTLLSEPGVPAVALSVPVDGGRYFGGHLATAQLRMARDGIDGASMVYLRVEDFLKLAGEARHPEQDKLNVAIEQGYRFNGMPSLWFDGDDGVVDVAVDGAHAGHALLGRSERIPVVLYPHGKQRFGSLVGFTRDGATIAMPNDALQEFHPERRGERMSVGSEAFRKWFGDSVVVDEQGRPLVVYHGTGRSFDAFERGRGSRGDAGQGSHIVDTGWFGSGFYFTPSGRVASHWADVRKTDEERNVMPVYLALRNPLVVDRPDYDSGATTLGKALANMGFFDESPSAQTAFLQSQGYDGVIANWGGKLDEIVAFEPTQIKSAIGNRGTWSAADPDIRYSLNSPLGTRVPQIDPDTYSVVHRETTSWLGRQMEKLARSKTDIPVLGNVTRVLFGGASPYELRVAQEDQYLSLLEMMERVRKEGGRITDSQNAYIAQQAAGSKATFRIQQHQQDIYDPLLRAIKDAHKIFTLKEYEEFLYARHAPERNAFLRARGSKAPNPSGMSEAEAQAVIDRLTKAGKIDAMRALDPLLNRLRDSITQTRVDGGLLAKDNASTTYRYWVPMQNGEDFDPFDQVSRRSSFTGRGMSVAGKENRPTVGRNSKAGDLLSNMILQDTMAVVRSEHAAFNRKLVEVVASNPQLAQQDVEIMTKPPLKSVVGSDGRIRTVVDPNFRSAPGYYVTKIAGREVVLKVNNPWIERALKGEFIQQTGPILQAIGSITRVLAAMRTTYNPTFVVTNLARDLQAAALNLAPQQIEGLARRMLAGVPASAKAVGAYMLSGDTSTEHGKYYQEMLENGWTVSHMGLQTLETVVDRVRADAHMAEGWKLTAQQAKNAVRNIFGAIEGTLGVAENGVRLSAYVEARRAGASIAQAGYLAKNLTVNFNKRGERSSAMNMMYMFYNAGVQGTSVLANMAKSKRGQKILATIILTGFVLDMINRMLSGDDNDDGIPDYDQFTEYELSRNLIVPNPLAALGVPNQSRYLKFPMPLGYNAAHNLGRNISNMFARKNKTWVDSLSSIATGTVDAFNPISTGGNFLNFVAPTFADPFVDMAANTDYAGRSIVPERPNYGGPEVPQSQLYWSTTDKSYVDIAQFLNELSGGNDVRKGVLDVSPEVLDYWFAFAAGGTGRFLMDMKYNITEGAPLALQGKFEDIDTTRLPLINVVVGSNVDRAAQQQYYELSKDVQTVEEEVKRFYEQGQPARAAAARKARPVEFAAAGMLSSSDRQLASLRKQIKALSENTMIRPDMKAKQLKLLRDQMDGVMTRTLRAYYQLKEAASP